jgi:hypothetical protein
VHKVGRRQVQNLLLQLRKRDQTGHSVSKVNSWAVRLGGKDVIKGKRTLMILEHPSITNANNIGKSKDNASTPGQTY